MGSFNIYPVTEALINALNGKKSLLIEPHDSSDPESADLVWIYKYPNGGMCEGEYLSLSPMTLNQDDWFASHNSADVCGGHPTFWSQGGTSVKLLPLLVGLVESRACELNDEK